MADLRWFARRLQAMGVREILWRLQQKRLQTAENRRFREKRPVTADNRDPGRPVSVEKLFINFDNPAYSLHTAIPLLAPYAYSDYKTRWHAGFQTENDWPLVPSSGLDYRGMDAVGDARTNWELNKHFQFALLAKDYRASGDRRYLDELTSLFYDWNEKNPFLWGISWTSGIEIAERTMNWCYMLGFLKDAADVPEDLLTGITAGIANMADWIFHHYSQYSSANNHLIIEISAVLHAGIVLENASWTEKAVEILTRELFLQDFADGVNREEALYYQAFMMEAYAMDLRLLAKNGLAGESTKQWIPLLTKMTRYVRSCIGKYGEVIEFGDNDDGKLLDLEGCDSGRAEHGGGPGHYAYLLQFMSMLLPERYVSEEQTWSLPWCESIRWLFTEDELSAALRKPMFSPQGSVDYAEGGNAILRSSDQEVLIGIDHAPLGYGALCAHGHADALSFIAFVRGKAFLCDPGTYIYHTDEEARNDFRRTRNHNTVCVGGADQSEMLGAFLWGKKAVCRLLRAETGGQTDTIEAEHDGYRPVMHRRRFVFDREEKLLRIEDHIKDPQDAAFSLLFSAGSSLAETDPKAGLWRCTGKDGTVLGEIRFVSGFDGIREEMREISEIYGVKNKTCGLAARICADTAVCEIRFGG